MRRATERVLQTITDWGLLSVSGKVYQACPPETIGRPELYSWLLYGILANAPEKFFVLPDLSNSGEFFFIQFQRL